ncbi:MAG: glycoside hydrolase family 2 TIM barrel-domain containing protein [Candidatus Merdivicinus sp.]|jgi:beta-galactosidase
MRKIICFDKNWKFHLGDIYSQNPIRGFEKAGIHNQTGARRLLDDSAWKVIDLPHDYVIEETFIPTDKAPSTETSIPEMWLGGDSYTNRGSLPRHIAWYRKTFEKMDTVGKRVFIRFDGIYRDSEIYLNNFFVGRHMSGYTGVTFDITDFIYENEENTIAVRVDPRKSEGWFYEGGGIYRHAWLIVTPLTAIAHHGVFVKSDMDWENFQAKITIQTTLHNYGNNSDQISISQTILSPNGETISLPERSATIPTNRELTIQQEVVINNPILWDIDSPNLYHLKTETSSGDSAETVWGIRDIKFEPDTGFYLNGRNIKIKGVCCHQDHGGLGVALPDGIQEYRIQKLKEMGCNAYRSAHNPATEELLQVCDRLGMLVMNENRLMSSSSEDLNQFDEMIRSSRNHPSVFMWSLGNEEGQIHFTENGRKITNTMRNHVKDLDGTRPVTAAVCFWDANSHFKGIDNPEITGILTNSVDVFGFNYFTDLWDNFRSFYPKVSLISTEHTSISCTRGCKKTDREKCHLSIIDCSKAGEDTWKEVKKRDYIAGVFIWTGFDYYGEPTPFGWPAISSQFGILDTCGFKKDSFYYYKACWDEKPVVHLCAGDGGVFCITNCDEVELFIGKSSTGLYKIEPDTIMRWNHINLPAEVRVVGYKNGKIVVQDSLVQYGSAAKLHAVVDGCFLEKDGSQTVVINIDIQDRDGNLVEIADNLITLHYSDQAKLLGMGNGDPSNHESCKRNYHRAFNGKLQVIFRIIDTVEIWIDAPGLTQTSVLVKKSW